MRVFKTLSGSDAKGQGISEDTKRREPM